MEEIDGKMIISRKLGSYRALGINLQDVSSYVYKMGLTLVAQGHGEDKRG